MWINPIISFDLFYKILIGKLIGDINMVPRRSIVRIAVVALNKDKGIFDESLKIGMIDNGWFG